MEIKTSMRIYQGVKVLVLGASDQGKTSIVQSMVDQQARLTDEDRTLGVDVYDHSISLEEDDNPLGKRLNLSIWDFSGNPRYLFQHQFFLQSSSLVLLVFNMAEYDDSKFRNVFGTWIDWIVSRTNRLIAIPVGTHADKLRPAKIKDISAKVMKQIDKYLTEMRESTVREIKRIESKAYISPALSEQLKLYINLTKLETVIPDTVIPISSKNFTGIEQLEEAMTRMVDNKDLFPNVLREIPSLWGELVNFVDDTGYAMQIPMMQWEDYVTLVTNKFGMRHLINVITEYMHDTGKLVWFGDHPTLRYYVFLRPSWLTDILKSLFRHDIGELDYNTEESFRQLNITPLRLEKMKKEVAEEGTFDRDFVKCLWANVFQTDMNRPVLEVLSMLLEHFQIGYATSTKSQRRTSIVSTISKASTGDKPDRDHLDILSITPRQTSSRKGSVASRHDRLDTMSVATNMTRNTDKSEVEPNNDPPKITKVLLPWLRDSKQPQKFKDDHQSQSNNPNITAVFRFPKYIPPGLFELLTIRAQKDEFELQNLYHWKTGIYARHMQDKIRFYLQKIDHDDGSTCVRTEVRHENQLPDETPSDKDVDQLWHLLLPFLKECEEIIAKYIGVRMERYMECPHCRSLSFLGEWLTPKELQSMDSKPCDSCKKDVSTAFLVQPKERKRVEEYLLQKLLEEADKRRRESALAIDDVTSDDVTVAGSDVIKINSSSSSSIAVSLSPTPETGSRKKSGGKSNERKKTPNGDKQKSSSGEKGTTQRNTTHVDRSAESKSPRTLSARSKAECHMTTLKE